MLPSPAPDTCWLFLLRHGATSHNLNQPPLLQGRGVNTSLSDVGRRQAEQTASFLKAAQFSGVYCSDLIRARETAQIIAAPHHKIPVDVRPDLMEVDVGRWENQSFIDIKRLEPEAFRLFMDDAGIHGFGGGENLTQVLERVRPVFDEILATHVGQTVAVVGHHVVNRTWLSYVLGLPLSKSSRLLQDNCCLNIVRYRAGETAVATLNSTFHLQAEFH